MEKIIVTEFLSTKFGISPDLGQKLFEKIKESLSNKEKIIVSFEGFDIFVSGFLNVAIGQLYKDFTDGEINKYVKYEDLDQSDLEFFAAVADNAKKYYAKNGISLKELQDFAEECRTSEMK